MVTATEAREAEAPPGRSPAGRWRWVVAGAAALVVVGAAIFLFEHQPLGPGCCSGHTDTRYRDGETFSYGVAIRNAGPFPVTITAVDAGEPGFHDLISPTGYFVQRDTPHAVPGDIRRDLYDPFHAFSLGPGEERGILIENVFEGCAFFARRTATTHGALRVSFTVLGVPRQEWVDFGNLFPVASPRRCLGRT